MTKFLQLLPKLNFFILEKKKQIQLFVFFFKFTWTKKGIGEESVFFFFFCQTKSFWYLGVRKKIYLDYQNKCHIKCHKSREKNF